MPPHRWGAPVHKNRSAPPLLRSEQSCPLRARARLVLLRPSVNKPTNRRPAPLPPPNQGPTKNGDLSGISPETCFKGTWGKEIPHGAYPLHLSANNFWILLLTMGTNSGMLHLPARLPLKVAPSPQQVEAPTSKSLLFLLYLLLQGLNTAKSPLK